MNSKENTIEKQVEQWMLLGPFIMMVVFVVLLINPLQQPLYVPIVFLMGIVFCWKWKLRGLAIALGCLSCVLVYQLWTAPIEKIFWNLMVAAAAALTFAITSLCGQEVEELLIEVQEESATNLHNFLGLNERMHGIESHKHQELNALTAKNELLQSQYELLQNQLNEEKNQLHTFQKRSLAVQEKMTSISNQNESLLRELFQKRHECDKLVQQLSKQAGLVEVNAESQAIKEQQLHTYEKEIEALRIAEKQYELQIAKHISLITDLQEQLKLNKQELQQSQNAIQEFMAASDKKEALLEQQLVNFQEKSQDNDSTSGDLTKKLKKVEKELNRMNGLYGQLKEQFVEKSTVLDSTRRELFVSQGQLEELLREKEEREQENFRSELEARLEVDLKTLENELVEAEEEHRKEINALQELIANLMSKEPSKPLEILESPKALEDVKNDKKPPAKSKNSKPTKTNHWANAILSRWSEPDGQSQ